MTSRLDRLFILLETGTNAVTKRAAAQQLGEAQRLHPHELHHLLARVSILLKSSQWDTRISAAHAVKAIISQVPLWDPHPTQLPLKEGELNEASYSKSSNKLSLENFDMAKVLAQSSHLTGSEGSEYDIVAGDSIPVQDDKMLAAKLGLDPHLIGLDTSGLFTSSDLVPAASLEFDEKLEEKISIEDTLQDTVGLSRREMNRARRKARQSKCKQRSRELDDGSDIGHSSNLTHETLEPPKKKIKAEDSSRAWYNFSSGTVTDSRCTVPDSTGCWPDSAFVWPLEAFAENLLQDLFSLKWEVRHGAATALRELIRLQGRGAGKSRKHTKEQMEESHRQWLVDAALRLLCVLGIDRFGDFISDQVVAPVRETCAQALGSLILMISEKNKARITSKTNGTRTNKNNEEEEETELQQEVEQNKDIMDLLGIMLKLLKHREWEARHGALLALKYLLAVRNDLLNDVLPKAFPAIMKGLSDPVEDVGAMAASALIPVAVDLPRILDSTQLEAVVSKLWQLLKDQDDLAVACNSFMGLLAAILSLPAARACLTPQPLSVVLPRLWPFLSHSSSSVRKATLETLETLSAENEEEKPRENRWGETGESSKETVLQEALRHVFERALIEHIASIQEVVERVWEKLIILSDLELLLHATCPLVSTWLCLAMQPEHVPFNPALLVHVQSKKCCRLGFHQQQHVSDQPDDSMQTDHDKLTLPAPPPPFKVYIGGVETVAQSTRHNNVIRSRCMAARMLGLLSAYVVKPAPGLFYSPEIPSPSLCYAKVLLAHLHSRSALQRTVAALTMAYWASLDHDEPPHIPDILRRQLFACLNECIYYDEIAGSVTRLLHECRDYMATLKHYNFTLPIEVNASSVITLEQIAQVATTPAILCTSSVPTASQQQQSANVKLKPKLLESLEERRRGLETGATAICVQQQAFHVSTQAALAGAATMLRCLPDPPQPLNPLIKPLMESIKREEHEQLQRLAARHLAHLVDLCVDRTPCPNPKIATNLCTFLCSDTEFTPRVISSDVDCEPFNGIITLNNRQKHAERQAYNRGNSNSLSTNRGPGRPPITDIPLEEILACEEPEAKAARTRRHGATVALTAIG